MQVYSDGSGFEGGISASVLLYINDHLSRSLHFYLGTLQEHTVYEAEGVGLILSLHLLHGLTRQLTHPTILGTDSQAVIRALSNQCPHSGHYLLDAIHLAAERLHAKQDGVINRVKRNQALIAGEEWKGDTRGVIDLQVHWVLGHCNFGPNERADEEAKLAAQGSSSEARFLPPLLHKKLPLSISALRQKNSKKLKKRWQRRWKSSERENSLRSIDNSVPSKKYLHLIRDLDKQQASILFQLHSGHVGLDLHLFHIHKAESPACPLCQGITVESGSSKLYLVKIRQTKSTLMRVIMESSGQLANSLSSSSGRLPPPNTCNHSNALEP